MQKPYKNKILFEIEGIAKMNYEFTEKLINTIKDSSMFTIENANLTQTQILRDYIEKQIPT